MTKHIDEKSSAVLYHDIYFTFLQRLASVNFLIIKLPPCESNIQSHVSSSLSEKALCPATIGALFPEILDECVHWRHSVSVFVSVQEIGNICS